MALSQHIAERYVSPTYNPHSLKSRWGLFLSTQNIPHIATLTAKYSDTAKFRTNIALHINHNVRHHFRRPESRNPIRVTDLNLPDISNPDVNITAAPIIFQDDIPGLEDLTREVGPDIVTLAVLSDVPLHRPRRLELEDLVGQWRWLRQVWAFFDTPDTNLIGANFGTAAINNAHYNADDKPDLTLEISQITDAIVACRLHIAIASLRSLFQKIKQQPADVENQAQISFLILLCLFCPYIGHELLYRYGIVEIPEQPES